MEKKVVSFETRELSLYTSTGKVLVEVFLRNPFLPEELSSLRNFWISERIPPVASFSLLEKLQKFLSSEDFSEEMIDFGLENSPEKILIVGFGDSVSPYPIGNEVYALIS